MEAYRVSKKRIAHYNVNFPSSYAIYTRNRRSFHDQMEGEMPLGISKKPQLETCYRNDRKDNTEIEKANSMRQNKSHQRKLFFQLLPLHRTDFFQRENVVHQNHFGYSKGIVLFFVYNCFITKITRIISLFFLGKWQ